MLGWRESEIESSSSSRASSRCAAASSEAPSTTSGCAEPTSPPPSSPPPARRRSCAARAAGSPSASSGARRPATPASASPSRPEPLLREGLHRGLHGRVDLAGADRLHEADESVLHRGAGVLGEPGGGRLVLDVGRDLLRLGDERSALGADRLERG